MARQASTADCRGRPGTWPFAREALERRWRQRAAGLRGKELTGRSLRKTMSMVPIMATRIREHVAAAHLIQRGQVRKPRRSNLQPVRLVRPVADDVDPELAFGMLDRRISLALWDVGIPR